MCIRDSTGWFDLFSSECHFEANYDYPVSAGYSIDTRAIYDSCQWLHGVYFTQDYAWFEYDVLALCYERISIKSDKLHSK